jgi:hypothetical protein
MIGTVRRPGSAVGTGAGTVVEVLDEVHPTRVGTPREACDRVSLFREADGIKIVTRSFRHSPQSLDRVR